MGEVTARNLLLAGGSPTSRWARLKGGEKGGDIPALSAVDYVGLLLHWYSGSVDGERIQINRRTKILLDEGLADALYHVEEDIVYEIHRK